MREPRIEIPFGEIDDAAERLLGRNTIAVAVVSMHGKEAGQWILCNPKHDKKLVAERLRLCADLLDPKAPAASLHGALENSQSLLAAMLHEVRPEAEIERQLIENREALK